MKKALVKMKNGKGDAIFDFQSDCLTSGPYKLVSHLTNLLKSYVSHGSVPYFILLLEGDKLDCDQLHFGFQAKSSTFMPQQLL